jgi:hypothetical protein
MNGVDELDNTTDRTVHLMSVQASGRSLNPVLGVRLPREELMQLLALARASGLSRSELTRRALHSFLKGDVNPLLTDTTQMAEYAPPVAPNRRAVELPTPIHMVRGTTPARLVARTTPAPRPRRG